MDMKALFETALNIRDPWFVSNIEFLPEEGTQVLHIHLDFKRGAEFSVQAKDGTVVRGKAFDTIEKKWRHMNFFQFKAYIHARVPRIKLPDDKGICMVKVPWAEPSSGFTLLFECFVLELVKHMSVLQVSRHIGETDRRVWSLVKRYVTEARKREDFSDLTALGIDETSKKGHNYITVFADLLKRKVVFVTDGKDSGTVARFVKDLLEHNGNPELIRLVTCDMSLGFKKGIIENFSNAQTVIDKFHVIKLANEAVDMVRKLEAKENPVLKKTKYLWLKNFESLSLSQQVMIDDFRKLNLKTAKAYHMRLVLQEIYRRTNTVEEAKAAFEEYCSWLTDSCLEPMVNFAQTLKKHLADILNYWVWRFTNALLEGLNNVIQTAKRRARGFRNNEYFQTIIYLVAGKLDLRAVCTKTV